MKNAFGAFDSPSRKLACLIVDLHGFTKMVAHDESILMANFIHDVFSKSVAIVERENGIIANTMGDAILALFEKSEEALLSSWSIIKDLWNTHEYIMDGSDDTSKSWPFVEKGIFCRCAIESGFIERSELHVRQGKHILWVGQAINHAQRIIDFPERKYALEDMKKNTLIVGPNAYLELNKYDFLNPLREEVKGIEYEGYPFDTRDIWGD